MWRLWKTQKFRKNPFRKGFSVVLGTTRIGKVIPKPSEIAGKPVGFLPTSPLLRHRLSHLARIPVSRSPHRKTFSAEPVENSIFPISPKSFPRFHGVFHNPVSFAFPLVSAVLFEHFARSQHLFRKFLVCSPHLFHTLWKACGKPTGKPLQVAENFPQNVLLPPIDRDSRTLQGIIPPKSSKTSLHGNRHPKNAEKFFPPTRRLPCREVRGGLGRFGG